MGITRYQKIFPEIQSTFLSSKKFSFVKNDLLQILNDNFSTWKLPKSMNLERFISKVVADRLLFPFEFKSKLDPTKIIYTTRQIDDYTLINAFNPKGYFTHSSALQLNGISIKSSETYYYNIEHTKSQKKEGVPIDISQDAINRVFLGQQRGSNNIWNFENKKMLILNGRFTNCLGVKNDRSENFSYTDLERTLIDITVRPLYAGGVNEVLKAYKQCLGKIDVKVLYNYFREQAFIYPYNQAIGFYLEHSGYSKDDLKHFKPNSIFDFYLAHGENNVYDKNWKIYYPQRILL